MYIRKTEDEFVVQGNYGYGWDDLTHEKTRKDAVMTKRDYDANEQYPHRIIRRRIKKGTAV